MSSPALHLRTYSHPTGLERHDHAQWVIPLRGELDFEVGGRGNRLGPLQGAFAAAGEAHDEAGSPGHEILIVDCPLDVLDDDLHDALRQRRWLALPAGGPWQDMVDRRDVSGLLTALLRHYAPASTSARLHGLCADLSAQLDTPWTVDDMARRAGVSVSRLHALFAGYFGRSPQEWLVACRLQGAKHALRHTDWSIARIAHAYGFSEHSALTRAFRRDVGVTPTEWRRAGQ